MKPASEHWILVRKPCSEKTVAANVLKHGVGGINIEASRIEGKPRTTHADGNFTGAKSKAGQSMPGVFELGTKIVQAAEPSGRFPANLILDEEAAAALDEQSGTLGNAFRPNRDLEKLVKAGNITRQGMKKLAPTFEGTGGASRFFYVAKASKSDKGEGNTHPTVKSTALMSYLIKLVTPPGGVVLDPFMGTGSTGVAAIQGGFGFVGAESYEQYHAIAQARIEHALRIATTNE